MSARCPGGRWEPGKGGERPSDLGEAAHRNPRLTGAAVASYKLGKRGSAMDFENLFKATFDQLVKRIVRLILFNLVGCLLCFTIVLIPTVTSGLLRGMLRYVREGIEPEFAELWSFDDFLSTLLLLGLGGLAIGIGLVLLIIPGLVLIIWWMYAPFFIVDKKMTFVEAMGASKRLVTETGFWNHFVVLLILTVLNSLGSGLAGLGTLLTAPFGLLLLTNLYLLSTRDDAASTDGPAM
jgi:hypothetical protein